MDLVLASLVLHLVIRMVTEFLIIWILIPIQEIRMEIQTAMRMATEFRTVKNVLQELSVEIRMATEFRITWILMTMATGLLRQTKYRLVSPILPRSIQTVMASQIT